LPNPALVEELLENVGWHKLEWNSPLLSFKQAGMELDFGGVVKEYAADRAAVICQDAGVYHGLINLGGDLRAIGPFPDSRPWIVGIQHPRQKDRLVTQLNLFHGGLASSGDYERCIIIDGKRYSHIINPKTGQPIAHMASVSVIGSFCLIAGSASTIGMLMEKKGCDWLNELGLPHIWVNDNGEIGGNY
jgi:thiamine biosynthesis lipoprotein